jgi:hypothetical protein
MADQHHQPADPHAQRSHDDVALSEQDQLAVDAWLARGGIAGLHETDANLANDPAMQRLAHVGSIMRLLEVGGPTLNPALIDLTFARVLRGRGSTPDGPQVDPNEGSNDDAVLSPDDEDAMEALVMAGFDPQRVTSSLRPRAAQLLAIGELAVNAPAPLAGGQLLIERTFQSSVRAREARGFEPSNSRRSALAWADIISVAAALLIATSVIWPMASTYRAHSIRQACLGNLGSLASAFGTYAGDFRGSMPMASASLGGQPWWNVGQSPAQSNSANLFTLARSNYTNLEQLACDGNALCSRDVAKDAMDWPALPNVSYSYFVMFGRARPSFSGNAEMAGAPPAKTVVLADASPVIRRAVAKQRVYPLENSANHAGTGQTVLRLDGSAIWLNTPVHEGDNIWLPADVEEVLREIRQQVAQGQQQGAVPLLTRQDAARQRAVRLEGTESPASVQDAFVGP